MVIPGRFHYAMILLDRQQTDLADNIAVRRRACAITQNKTLQRGLDALSAMDRLMLEVLGARAELAAHLLFGVEWRSAFSATVVRNGDINGFIEVKGVGRPKDRLLIKEEKARPDHAYLLLDGTLHPSWYPIGWIWGREAMLEKFRGNFGGAQPDCFIIPRTIPPLHPVRELFAVMRSAHAASPSSSVSANAQ